MTIGTQLRTPQRPYALYDLDGTLSQGFISLAFMDYIHDRGLYADDDYQHQQDILAQYKAKTLSYDNWVTEWGTTWAHGLKGQQETEVRAAAKEFFETYKPNLYPQSRYLVTALKEHGYDNLMISAGVYEVVDLARQELGLDGTLATRAHVEHGVYTGALDTNLHVHTGKAEAIGKLGGHPTFAFGDSSGDIGMLSLADVPVALNPNEDLAREATQRGWHQMPIAQAPAFIDGWLLN